MAASTLCPTLAQESVRVLRRRGVETVILAGADTHGIMRGKRVPIGELDRAAERGIALCDVIWALPVDEVAPVQPPPGHDGWFPRDGYPDMLAMPDLETARIVPWHDRTALLLCDFVDRDGRAIPLSPRAVLRSVVERAAAMGVEPIVGIELEFYALRETPQSVLTKRPSQLQAVQERPSVYGVVAASRHEDFAGAVRTTLREYGLAVEACAPEAGPGQFEITVRAAPALRRPTRRSCSRARSRRSPRGTGCWPRSWPSRARTGRAARATCTSACATARPPRCATSSAACWRGWPS